MTDFQETGAVRPDREAGLEPGRARIAATTEGETMEYKLRKALSDACDVAIWMSGSPTFGPEGEGFEAWTNTMRPKLFEALDILKEAEANVPA